MMERYKQWQQLNLLELAAGAIQRQRFDPMIRRELTSLLKLLINECGVAVRAKVVEADDEQDHA